MGRRWKDKTPAERWFQRLIVSRLRYWGCGFAGYTLCRQRGGWTAYVRFTWTEIGFAHVRLTDWRPYSEHCALVVTLIPCVQIVIVWRARPLPLPGE